MGIWQFAGVGHELPAAAAQLHRAATHPLGAPRVRTALPVDDRPHARRSARRPPPHRYRDTRGQHWRLTAASGNRQGDAVEDVVLADYELVDARPLAKRIRQL